MDDPECLAMFREAIKGEPGRNRETDNNVISLDTPQGNSRAYSIDRVKRECEPEVVAKVMSTALAGSFGTYTWRFSLMPALTTPPLSKGTFEEVPLFLARDPRRNATHSPSPWNFQKNMIALKKRLESLEFSTELYHQRMAARAQKELGLTGLLPLPACSDLSEARIRLKKMVDALVKLPLGVKDPAVEAIVLEFRNWVVAEHARAKHEQAK